MCNFILLVERVYSTRYYKLRREVSDDIIMLLDRGKGVRNLVFKKANLLLWIYQVNEGGLYHG
ncbi:hypothetical protein [Anaerostipes faecalis]|uniref:hypothetical protein n=1 Tax=Anaerostipes faecalis TaxID=2738446 RepID=UPI0009511426|nr:hypothetical protein BHF70_06365 [Anaerostipes sp. 494a]